MVICCSVCLHDLNFSDQNISVLKCGHMFHHDCLQEWIQSSKTCPDCRRQIGKNSLVKKVYPKVSEDNTNIYSGNSSESKALFELLAKNNECSQKAVCKRIVELENNNKDQTTELNELKCELQKLQKSLEISESNITSLHKENCNLKNAIEILQVEKKEIETGVDAKVRKAVEPYLQMKKEVESYKEKISLISRLTSQIQIPKQNPLENLPSTSNG